MITEATIFVSNYEETLEFYKNLFKNIITETSSQQFQINVQWNTLKILEEERDEKPYYHFCFLIPKSHFKQAKEYVSKIVPLNTKDGEDEISFMEEIQSFYFYDPSENIVEFMGKDSVDDPVNDIFAPEEVLALNEMSLVTNNLEKTATKLHDKGIIEKEPSEFKASGLIFVSSDNTTVLLSATERTWLFSDKYAKVFPQEINIDGKKIVVTQDKKIQIS